jgi:ABC-type Na+ efflux pump permease subunit
MSTATAPPPPGRLVPRSGIIATCLLGIVFGMLTLYSLWAFWPLPLPAQATAEASRKPQHVYWLWWEFNINREFLFFLTVALAGALGGLIHNIRSFAWYVGNRNFRWSWVPYYLMLPLVGALAGTVFYLVLRAGLFSPSTSVEQASPFGFAAIAILSGLFSPQAFEKLRELAANVFTEPKPGADHTQPRDPGGPGAQPQDDEPGAAATSTAGA